jgi:large subunit ribosomal protein L21
MYAIIEVGAKQYNVKKDDVIEVEKQVEQKNDKIVFDKVLMVCDEDKVEVGKPYLANAKVTGVVLDEIKGEKTIAYKYRRRKAFHWKKGHRQQLTLLKIKDISLGG